MVRTAVCGAADEGSIPSGHPTTREECTFPSAAPSRHLVDVLTLAPPEMSGCMSVILGGFLGTTLDLREALLIAGIGGIGGSLAFVPLLFGQV